MSLENLLSVRHPTVPGLRGFAKRWENPNEVPDWRKRAKKSSFWDNFYTLCGLIDEFNVIFSAN